MDMIYEIQGKNKKHELRPGDLCEIDFSVETKLSENDKIYSTHTKVGYFYRVHKNTHNPDLDTLVLVNELSDGQFKDYYCDYEDEMYIPTKDITVIRNYTF